MQPPKKGNLLIAEPFLLDQFFSRSVVLLCEHLSDKGSVGFLLNRLLPEKLNHFFPELENTSIPIFYGGPVRTDRLHFLHTLSDVITDGVEVAKGIYWGGDFEAVKILIEKNAIDLQRIKFFLGYSGWEQYQLDKELQDEAWIISNANKQLIFEEKEENIWRQALLNLGGDYAKMSNFPLHPSLN